MAQDLITSLREAVAAVEEAGVPQDLRVSAFRAVLASKGVGPPPNGTAVSAASEASAPTPPEPAAEGSGIGKIAKKLGVAADRVGRVFDVDEEEVHLLISTSSLQGSKKGRQQELTLLTVAARQAADIDADLTSINDVRTVLSDYGLLDRNLSTSIADLKGAQMRFAGTATKRQFKMNQPGFEAVAEIVKRLTE